LGSNELQQGTATRHYQCALLQADGRRDLELDTNQGDGSDLFAAIAGTALSTTSSPNTREWDGRDSGLVISDITTPGPTITFSVGQAVPAHTASGAADPMLPIPDNAIAGVSSAISIAESGVVAAIKVSVDIEHTWIGDLRVTLTSPAGRTTVLHAQLGGSRDDLVATYDSASPGVLADMIGQPLQGDWILRVVDRARRDVGTLRRWTIELSTSATLSVPGAVPVH
jgi:subtilisin-like proprotein convertase family protein